MSVLVSRPLHHMNEHIIGYVLRLAKENCFDNLDAFFESMFDFKVYRCTTSHSLQNWVTLASRLTGEPLVHEQFDDAPGIGHFSVLRKFHPLVVTSKPHVCPDCIDNLGYIKREWSFTPLSFCKEHRKPLINICPHCDNELKWEVSLLDGLCSVCFGSINESNSECIVPEHINQLTNRSKNIEQYIKNLSAVASSLIRPYDFIPRKVIRSCEMTGNYHELYALAYQVLNGQCEEPNPLLFLTNQEYADYPCREFAKSQHYLKLKKCVLDEPSDELCRNLAAVESIQKHLGLSKANIEVAQNIGFVSKRYFIYQSSKKWAFDMKEWVDAIFSLPNRRQVCDPISMKQAQQDSMIFSSEPDAVINGILQGEIQFNFIDDSIPDFREVVIERSSVYNYFVDNRIDLPHVANLLNYIHRPCFEM